MLRFSFWLLTTCRSVFLIVADVTVTSNRVGDYIYGSPGDSQGYHFAFSADGGTVAVGEMLHDRARGRVHVHRVARTGEWRQVGESIDGESPFDHAGSRVALTGDGKILAVAAYYHPSPSDARGRVRIFHFVNGDWRQLGGSIDGESPHDKAGVGLALSADGSRVAIGSQGHDANGQNSGCARVYRFWEGNWQKVGESINGATANEFDGTSLAISDDGWVVAVGSHLIDANGADSGGVRVFYNTKYGWQQWGDALVGVRPGDWSGFSISLTEDGQTIAISSPGHDAKRGSVSVFEYRGPNHGFVQIGSIIEGEHTGDFFGTSVSLSGNGTALAVGAYAARGGAGQVRLFHLHEEKWVQTRVINGKIGEGLGHNAILSQDAHGLAISSVGYDAIRGRMQVLHLTTEEKS